MTEACVLLHKDGGLNIIFSVVVVVATPSMPKEKEKREETEEEGKKKFAFVKKKKKEDGEEKDQGLCQRDLSAGVGGIEELFTAAAAEREREEGLYGFERVVRVYVCMYAAGPTAAAQAPHTQVLCIFSLS